jgi:3-deoxy-D-manno-octulosonic-acid transferase/heptosyltransferase-1
MLNGIPRILIVRLSAIGDVVRVLPALHSLRAGFPNAQIDWAVEAKAAGILDGHPDLDRVLVFERAPEWRESWRRFWHFCRDIRRSKYDVVIDFHGILKSGLIAGASRAPERYGFARPRAQEGSFLFTSRRLRLNGDLLNRIEENLRLSEMLAPRHDAWDGPGIFVPEEVQEEVENYFESFFDGGKACVAIHVPVDRPEKAWPAEHYGQLADMLLGDGRFEVVLTWGPGQYAQVDAVLKHAKRSPDVAPEMESLKHYAWLIRCADLYFGGDTGPMHIAAAMGTPVVAVFGGTNPVQHAPLRVPCEILGWNPPGSPTVASSSAASTSPPVMAASAPSVGTPSVSAIVPSSSPSVVAVGGGRELSTPKLPAAERLKSVTAEDAYDACLRVIARPTA